MTWGSLSEMERLDVAHRRGVKNEPWESIFERLGPVANADSFRRQARQYIDSLKQAGHWPPDLSALRIAYVAASKRKRHVDWLRVTGDALILSDLQVPMHDGPFINRCIVLARAWGIPTCLVNGDLFNFVALSKWGADESNSVNEDLDVGEQVIERLAVNFATVKINWGNHDDRLMRLLERRVDFQRLTRLMTLAENVQFTPYYFILLESGGRTWRITHPKNASTVPAQVPRLIAEREEQNTIGGHGHLWGQAVTRSGRYMGIDSGMCADPARLQYAAERDSTYPKMQQGAVIVRHGYAWLLHPTFTDWTALMGMGKT